MVMHEVRFTRHALERIYARGIAPEECEMTVHEGTTIERYPDDKPFPSELRLLIRGDRVIHVVVALGPDAVHVITAYIPDPTRWREGFTRRS